MDANQGIPYPEYPAQYLACRSALEQQLPSYLKSVVRSGMKYETSESIDKDHFVSVAFKFIEPKGPINLNDPRQVLNCFVPLQIGILKDKDYPLVTQFKGFTANVPINDFTARGRRPVVANYIVKAHWIPKNPAGEQGWDSGIVMLTYGNSLLDQAWPRSTRSLHVDWKKHFMITWKKDYKLGEDRSKLAEEIVFDEIRACESKERAEEVLKNYKQICDDFDKGWDDMEGRGHQMGPLKSIVGTCCYDCAGSCDHHCEPVVMRIEM